MFVKENAKGFEGKSVYMNGAEYPVYPFRNKATTQHREFEKIAFSQETGGQPGWKLGRRQFLGETISRNEIRKRFCSRNLS